MKFIDELDLTWNESRVLRAVVQNAEDAAGLDFAFVDEVQDALGGNRHGVAATLGHLQSKGHIVLDEPHTVNEGDTVHQITLSPALYDAALAHFEIERASDAQCAAEARCEGDR